MERIHVTITPSMLLIVLPMVFLAATVDAISGGGGLISLPAYTMAGLSYDFAAGNNKFSSTFGTLTATVRYFRSGRLRVAPALCAVVGALPGSYLGTRTAMALGNEAMRAFMVFAIPVVGAVVLLLIIFALLKRGLMSVKYSLLWLALAVGLVIAAAFPYVVYVLRDLLDIEMPVNLVFLLMFCFVLVVLLSLSIAISQLADKCKRLTQANAMLEKRVRDLEEKK